MYSFKTMSNSPFVGILLAIDCSSIEDCSVVTNSNSCRGESTMGKYLEKKADAFEQSLRKKSRDRG